MEDEKSISAAIMEKLRKLMAQEEGERALGNMGAAESFAAKVQGLLIKYKLSLSDVEAFAQEADNPFASTFVSPPQFGERWKPRRIARIENLAEVVARAHFCRILIVPDKNCVFFAGRKQDADVAAYVFKKLARTAWALCEKEREAAKKRAQRTPGLRWTGNKEFRYSFYWGFASAIEERYKAQRASIELEAGNCQALVRAERDVEIYVKDFTQGREIEDSPTEEGKLSRDALRRGYEIGKVVPLTADALNSSGEQAKQLGGGE